MWYSRGIEDVLHELRVKPDVGLSAAEAKRRLAEYGPNEIEQHRKKSVFKLFVDQLKDWLIYVLMAAVLITLFMGEYIDAIIITVVILLNAALGVFQEVKAGNAIEALQRIAAPKALIRRDGVTVEVEAKELVPGDIVVLDAGRVVPADLRLLTSVHLQIEESAFTGESLPSEKRASERLTAADTPLGDRINMAYMSTLVSAGRGTGVVVATGMHSEMGAIAKLITAQSDEKTPLEKRLDHLGKMLGKIAIAICVTIFIIALLQQRDVVDMFLLSVSLAVAAIPEGLVAIVAIVLSIGVTLMSRRNAIIRRLPAVETLGSVNVVCSDKTGTLTQNRMTVSRHFAFAEDGKVPAELAKAMVLCNDATLANEKATGDPTEVALLLWADTLGLNRKELAADNERIAERAFDSDRKLMSTLYKNGNDYTVYTKGAIDNLILHCSHVLEEGEVLPLTNKHRAQIEKATSEMSASALRTLGAAFKVTNASIGPGEMEEGLVLLGLVGMSDPPREGVKEAIATAGSAGISTVMITGDHKATAFAIAKELGIASRQEQAITGQEVEEMAEDTFVQEVNNYRVFARVSPEHKVRIVRALKANGNIVSMTGDGVNDAPSLQEADIGVAMGITGTDVAKSAADIILTDDNFTTIVKAIELGRNIYSNIKKSVVFLLMCNLGEVIVMFLSFFVGWQAPLIATQLLWINLLTDSLPAVSLGMDPIDHDVMKEQPRSPKENFFAGGAGLRVLIGGLLTGTVTAAAFWYGHYSRGESPFHSSVPEEVLRYARTIAFMVLVGCQLFLAFTVRSSTKSVFQIGLFSNKYLIGSVILGFSLQMLVLFVPFLREAFKLQMISIQDGWLIVGFSILPMLLSELRKLTKKLF
ncbi:cation-translocating P-type ATPase [Olivibacter sp. XZL3]|uniref:cation-translocating P-type ATPase n=1 Tax=Olivibacter sp. XZL3 TaxID=1735116 RepID=UPI001064ADD3|nr:cation-translocating P-type ATPase [Olivibacter sp. XZL3]